MASTITFNLRNNQMTDLINVNVTDLGTNQQVNGTYTLNRDESVDIQIVADSWGKGKASWQFWSTDGSINSNKQQVNIADGDECTLG
jgi:predicted transcriptional regulator